MKNVIFCEHFVIKTNVVVDRNMIVISGEMGFDLVSSFTIAFANIAKK